MAQATQEWEKILQAVRSKNKVSANRYSPDLAAAPTGPLGTSVEDEEDGDGEDEQHDASSDDMAARGDGGERKKRRKLCDRVLYKKGRGNADQGTVRRETSHIKNKAVCLHMDGVSFVTCDSTWE